MHSRSVQIAREKSEAESKLRIHRNLGDQLPQLAALMRSTTSVTIGILQSPIQAKWTFVEYLWTMIRFLLQKTYTSCEGHNLLKICLQPERGDRLPALQTCIACSTCRPLIVGKAVEFRSLKRLFHFTQRDARFVSARKQLLASFRDDIPSLPQRVQHLEKIRSSSGLSIKCFVSCLKSCTISYHSFPGQSS